MIFGPFVVVYFMLDRISTDAQNGIDSTVNVKIIMIVGALISFFVYPVVMYALYSHYGIIKKRDKL